MKKNEFLKHILLLLFKEIKLKYEIEGEVTGAFSVKPDN